MESKYEMFASVDMAALIFSMLHGVFLTAILIGVYRRRAEMLFSKAILVLVGLLSLFLFVDGIVSGPYAASIGLVIGGTIMFGLLTLHAKRHQSGRHVSS